MNLLNPIALFGLFALLVPLILHLIQRSDTKEKDWAAMEFLLEKEAHSVRKHSLREWLLLLCRLLLIAFLILALAQPLGRLFSSSSDTPESIFLLLDRSSDMGAETGGERTLMAETIESVSSSLEAYGDGVRLYLLDSASLEIIPVIDAETLAILPQAKIVDTPTDIPRMLEVAMNELASGTYGKSEVWIVSDGAPHKWSPQRSFWKTGVDRSVSPTVRHIPVERREGDLRLSIESAQLTPDGAMIMMNITGGREAQEVTIQRTMTGETTQSHQITLSDNTDAYPLAFPVDEGLQEGLLSLSEDENTHNNAAPFLIGPTRGFTTIVVTDEQNSTLTESLLKSVSLRRSPFQKSRWLSPQDFFLTDLSGVDAVVWASTGEGSPLREKIEALVKEGKLAVIFPNPSKEGHEADWFFDSVQEAPQEEFFTVTDWDKKDGPFRNANSGDPLPLEQVQSVAYAQLNPSLKNSSVSLARWNDGAPLISRALLGEGTLYLVSSLPHYSWSNLENLALHLVFSQRLITEQLKSSGGGYMQFLQPGKKPQEVGVYTEEGNKSAYNRPVVKPAETFTPKQMKQLISKAGLDTARSSQNSYRSWIEPFLYLGMILLFLECFFITRRKKRKEAAHV